MPISAEKPSEPFASSIVQTCFSRNTAKVALSAQVVGIRQVGDLLPSAYFACSYIASEGVSS